MLIGHLPRKQNNGKGMLFRLSRRLWGGIKNACMGGTEGAGLLKKPKKNSAYCRLDELICNIECEDLLTTRRDLYGQLVLQLKG